MEGFLPRQPLTPVMIALLCASVLTTGYLLGRRRLNRSVAAGLWVQAAVAGFLAEWFTAREPAGVRMLAIITVLFFAMKGVVLAFSRSSGAKRLSAVQWLGFSTLWTGMRPEVFLSLPGRRLAGVEALFNSGIRNLVLGSVLFLAARLIWSETHSAGRIASTALVLVAFSLGLHFGLLNLQAAFWRTLGVDAGRLFQAPLHAQSLGEFWGRRWNLAFQEMTATAVYLPSARRLGTGGALFLSFLVSGLLHEAAISLPVRSGYGLPLLYFSLHGLLVLTERRFARLGRPVESWGIGGRIWTAAWLIVPLPILVHRAFREGVLWPLLY